MSNRIQRIRKGSLRLSIAAVVMLVSMLFADLANSRPAPQTGKGSKAEIQRFFRQQNSLSNMAFYLTNRGVIFNNDDLAGLTWPRGSKDAYIFGGGMWFATKKVLQGRRRKLAELGYNPNSGAGWYTEGEINAAPDGAPKDSKYITYMSPRYSEITGRYIAEPNQYVPAPAQPWPIWDTAEFKVAKQNYYFGDYISDVNSRNVEKLSKGKKVAKPLMISQEDIVNIYTDADVSANPEFRPGTGYPFNLNIVEIIYSWSFGRYRDMVFLRYVVTNSSKDTLNECFLAPAFDPDLGPSGRTSADNDRNAAVTDSATWVKAPLQDLMKNSKPEDAWRYQKFIDHPSKLNMAWQNSEREGNKELGWIGFSFLESPVVDEGGRIINISDSSAVGGYSNIQDKQLGLHTFKKWTIQNDPPTQDLRYDFVSAGTRDPDNVKGDVRMLFSTGPFTLPPGTTVQTTVAIGIAKAGEESLKNRDSLVKLIATAHFVYAKEDTATGIVTHFESPRPPEIPQMQAHSLDRAVLITWDSTAEVKSLMDTLLSPGGLPFVGYQLYRTTRADRDSTIRPDGENPIFKLGEWSLYSFKRDSVVNSAGKVLRYFNVRTNSTPRSIPHSYLDVGDNNKDGLISGDEGLKNGVRYYYYLVAYDEYDSIVKVGPLSTAIISGQNFVSTVPSKPPFIGQYNTAGTLGCAAAGIKAITLDVIDTGKFLQLHANDTFKVSFRVQQNRYNIPNNTPLLLYVDVVNDRTERVLTFEEDKLLRPTVTPYNFETGIVQYRRGQEPADSSITGRFVTEQETFQPYQRINEAVRVVVDYEFQQMRDQYKLRSVVVSDPAKKDIVRLSQRTAKSPWPADTAVRQIPPFDMENIDTAYTRPSPYGALGESTFEVRFGDAVPFSSLDGISHTDWDTVKKALISFSNIRDSINGANYDPEVLKVSVVSKLHCDAELKHVRPQFANSLAGGSDGIDVNREYDAQYYRNLGETTTAGVFAPQYNDPDTMLVPTPGKFAIDAFHFTYDDGSTPASGTYFGKTSAPVYFPLWGGGQRDGARAHAAVHRLRIGGAEIILNAAGISQANVTGDTLPPQEVPSTNDFRPNDKITVSFTGMAKSLPMPGEDFKIYTRKGDSLSFANSSMYNDQVLEQVQVVPNPYIVTHEGQSSTDNAKLFFTRLPPRATIEIYSMAGDLVKTIEHNGFVAKTTTDNGVTDTVYNYNQLADRSSVQEWNLLSEGRQRIGSQVFIARIIAKDPITNSPIGETTTKFAVVVGGFRVVQ